MASAIAAAGARLGGIRQVVLGHGDTDHRGSAPALSKVAPVVCHPDAVAQAEGSGGRDYWRMEELPRAIRLLHSFTHRFVWDGGPVTISGTVSAGERIAGFEVIDLAGHAPGQIGLWRESDGVALVSDTVYLVDSGRLKPLPEGEASVPHPAWAWDHRQAKESVRKLAALDPAVLGTGHEQPLRGESLRATLERAAEKH
jgi:hydroxyacylglutathione hydrolase